MITRRDMSRLLLGGTMAAGFATQAKAQTSWDLSVPWGPGVFHTRNAVKFSEKVAEVTRGELKITVHPGASLGIKGPETLRSVRSGIVPIAEGAMLTMVGDAPVLGFDSIPYLVETYSELRTLHEMVRPLYQEAMERQGVVVLYMVPWEPTNIFTKKKIEKPEDFKGLKMRTFDRNTSELLTRLGIAPIQIAVPDVVPALASGTLDATMTSFGTAYSQKYWEFMKYGYLTNHVWATNAMIVNKAALEKLSPEHQKAIREAARQIEPEFWKVSEAEDPVMMENLRKNGMEIAEAPPEVLKAMRDASRPMWMEFANRIGGKAPEIMQAYLKKTGR